MGAFAMERLKTAEQQARKNGQKMYQAQQERARDTDVTQKAESEESSLLHF